MAIAPTRFHTISPWRARAALFALVAIIFYGFYSGYTGLTSTPKALPPGKGDVYLYQAVVARMDAGESYYAAAAGEMTARGYPTSPFLTWRLPTTAWLISALPSDNAALIVLRLLALATALMWSWALYRAGASPVALAIGTLLVGSGLLLCLAENAIYFHESWAMYLIALSLALHGGKTWGWSVALGILALCFRELALPYACVMLGIAWFERRREAFYWMAGIAVFLVALAAHATIVSQLGTDAGQSRGWLYLGGWGFVLSISQWSALFAFLPPLTVPIIIPLALLGLGAWRHPLGKRLAFVVGMYVAAFMFVGRPDNTYWGLIYAPLLPLGLLFTPAALRDLWHAAAISPATRLQAQPRRSSP